MASLRFSPLSGFISPVVAPYVSGTVLIYTQHGTIDAKSELQSFAMIIDGATSSNVSCLIAQNRDFILPDGRLNFMPRDFLKTIKLVLLTGVSEASIDFLCLLYAHFRSAAILSLILADPEHAEAQLAAFWNPGGTPDDSRKWVDICIPKSSLPHLVISSSTARMLRLVAQGHLNDNRRFSHVWETVFLSHVLGEGPLLGTDNAFYSPLTRTYLEIIFSKFNRISCPTLNAPISILVEECANSPSLCDWTFKLCSFPAGGNVGNVVWVMTLGGEENASHFVLSGRASTEQVATFHARLSRPLSPNGIRAYADQNVKAYVGDVGGHVIRSLDEPRLTDMIRKTFLDSESSISTVLIPTDVESLIALVLCIELIWANITVLRERVSVFVVGPVAPYVINSILLLLDSFSVDMSEPFVESQLYILSALLLTHHSRRSNKKIVHQSKFNYFSSEAELSNFLSKDFVSQKLILATPADLDVGTSRALFKKYICSDPSASVWIPPHLNTSLITQLMQRNPIIQFNDIAHTPPMEETIVSRMDAWAEANLPKIPRDFVPVEMTKTAPADEIFKITDPLDELASSINSFFVSKCDTSTLGIVRYHDETTEVVSVEESLSNIDQGIGDVGKNRTLYCLQEFITTLPLKCQVNILPFADPDSVMVKQLMSNVLQPRHVIDMALGQTETVHVPLHCRLFDLADSERQGSLLDKFRSLKMPSRSIDLWKGHQEGQQEVLVGQVKVRVASSIESQKPVDLPTKLPAGLLAAFQSVGAILKESQQTKLQASFAEEENIGPKLEMEIDQTGLIFDPPSLEACNRKLSQLLSLSSAPNLKITQPNSTTILLEGNLTFQLLAMKDFISA